MNKLVVAALLVLAIAALQTESTHEQTKAAQPTPAPIAPHPYAAQPTPNNQVRPAQQNQQAQPRGQPQRQTQPTKSQPRARVAFEAELGDPFGRQTATKRTCFKAPCYEPTTGCAAPKKWNAIFYLVPTANGQKGRFVGYECK